MYNYKVQLLLDEIHQNVTSKWYSTIFLISLILHFTPFFFFFLLSYILVIL